MTVYKLYALTQDGFKFQYETTDEAAIDNDVLTAHQHNMLVWKITVNNRE